MFQLFIPADCEKSINFFIQILNSWFEDGEDPEIQQLAGTFFHELIDICEMRGIEPFEFSDILVKILRAPHYRVQVSPLP